MNVTFQIIPPRGPIEQGAVDWLSAPPTDAIRAVVLPILQADQPLARHMEHVAVLFNDQRADMFVDEDFNENGSEPNPRATEIYHAASKASGASLADAPIIRGTAILFSTRVWF
jgi:hypothetical protein